MPRELFRKILRLTICDQDPLRRRLPNVRDKGHAAEKPTGLYVELLKRSCLPRDRVLDPCCGSGTIFQAARETYTTATGIECDEKTYGLALTKLQDAAVDEMLAAE